MIPCANCKAPNRETAHFCRQCGAKLIQLKPGELLTACYQIMDRLDYSASRGLPVFEARELRTGAKCWAIPIGPDPAEDHWAQQLASLRHQALPKMDIADRAGAICLICYTVEGIPLDSISIQSPAQLLSIGLQLSDLLQATGMYGTGFSWVDLQAPHVLLDHQGHIQVDNYRYWCDWLYEHRPDPFEDRLIAHHLSFYGWAQALQGQLSQQEVEAAEVEIVGTAMALPLVGHWPLIQLDQRSLQLRLHAKLPDIPPHLERAMLGAVIRKGKPPMPQIRSLPELREQLLMCSRARNKHSIMGSIARIFNRRG
jgi:hypothetical protein